MIVCGLEGVGLRTVEQLHHAGVRVVVIDDRPDARLTRIVRGWGVPHLVGSPQLAETLAEAGVAGALAVICALADDLQTLETALLARELRADLRVVVQIRNPAVGRALATANVAVLDVGGLSAPSVVEACLRTGTHPVLLDGERFLIVSVLVTRPGSMRFLYGDLAPIAVTQESGEVVVCPGRDHVVHPGDTVSLLGTPDQLTEARVAWTEPQTAASTGGWTRARRVRALVASLLTAAADRRLLLVLCGLFTLLVTATTVLRLGYREPNGRRMTILDAVYFTVETIGTVGYGDFSFRQQHSWLRVFAVCLMIVGASMATLMFALLTNVLVTHRIEESLGRRRVSGLSGHVVVIGLGSIGLRVLQQLQEAGSQVVVVDSDEGNRYLAQVRAAGVPVVIADATLPQTLDSVNITGARAVAVLTSDDLVNLETGLAVRDQLVDLDIPIVLRLFERQLARTIEKTFEIGLVRSTAALAAPWFVGAALGLEVLGTFYVADTPMLVARLDVAAGGGLENLAMSDLSAKTRVVAISRAAEEGRLEHPPRRGTRFSPGDRAFIVGPYDELLAVLRRDSLSPSQLPAPVADPAARWSSLGGG